MKKENCVLIEYSGTDPPKQMRLTREKEINGYYGNKFLWARIKKKKSFVSNRFRLAKQVQSGFWGKRHTQIYPHDYHSTRNAEVCLVWMWSIHVSIHPWWRVFKRFGLKWLFINCLYSPSEIMTEWLFRECCLFPVTPLKSLLKI